MQNSLVIRYANLLARKDMATLYRVEKALNFMVNIDVRKPLRGRLKKIIPQRQICLMMMCPRQDFNMGFF